ncbi:MAG: 1-acyl-sn-glycerol-3-phosphate acyltransferase [Cyclobacteriaceae bacterium]
MTGWSVQGNSPENIPKYVLIVAPHTSSWDFFVGVAARSIARIENVKFIGKKELFRFPLGMVMKFLGGYPVDRSKNNNLVENVVSIFSEKEKFAIALAPEGTRQKVKKLRSGFYHIAKKAGIPIIMVGFDFKKKVVDIQDPFYPTDNTEADMEFIWHYFTGVTGQKPELGIS